MKSLFIIFIIAGLLIADMTINLIILKLYFKEKFMGKEMSFGHALEWVKKGWAIQRLGWNGNNLKVKLQAPDDNAKMSLPYLYIEYPANAKTTPGAKCPWLASQTDILAEDWIVIKE